MRNAPAVQVQVSAAEINRPAELFRQRAREARARAQQYEAQANTCRHEADVWDSAAAEIDTLMERVVIPQLRNDPTDHRTVAASGETKKAANA